MSALKHFVKSHHMSRTEIRYFDSLCDEIEIDKLPPERQTVALNWLILSVQIRREFKKICEKANGDIKLFTQMVALHTSLSKSLGFLPKEKSSDDVKDLFGIGEFLTGRKEVNENE